MIRAAQECYVALHDSRDLAPSKVPMTKPTGPSQEDKDAQTRRDTVNLLAVIICLVILILGFWLVNRLWEMKKLQDCIFAGRRDCAPIETTR